MPSLITKKILGRSILCHAWNKDHTQLALCPGDNCVAIYNVTWTDNKPTFTEFQTIKVSESAVVAMSWAPTSNLIAVCSHDRSASVLFLDEATGMWGVKVVNLTVSRAITCLSWAKDEKKFVLGSGAKALYVCTYAQEFDLWTSKVISTTKQGDGFVYIDGTVLSVDYHPAGLHIVSGGVDKTVRICTSYVKGVDSKPTVELPLEPKGKPGHLLFEHDIGSWVQAVHFSPSGNYIAAFGYASCIYVRNLVAKTEYTVKLAQLPFNDFAFVDDNTIVAGGHDCEPILFHLDHEAGTVKAEKLDNGQGAAAAPKKSAGFGSAMSKFQNLDSRGQEASSAPKSTTQHGSAISAVQLLDNGWVSTSAFDGSLCIW